MIDPLHLLVVGAHPDDCSIKAGGIAATYVEAGHDVTFCSATDGSAGHHELDRDALARRRRAEAEAVSDVLEVDYEVFDVPDGELVASLEHRHRFVEFLRDVDPDLVLGPRPNDYHPDHRACATLLRDAAYLLIVPNVCPETPALDEPPTFGFVPDPFEQPTPFDPDVVLDVTDVADRKLDALHCHESQVYEWLPYTTDQLDAVPDDDAARRAWLERGGPDHLLDVTEANVADRFRDALVDRYGPEVGKAVEHAEAVEFAEYGTIPSSGRRDELFFF